MGLGDALRDGESEPEAAGLPAAGRVGAIEAVEDVFEVIDRDDGPAIVDGKRNPTALVTQRHIDVRLWLCVLDRIVD